VPFYVTTILEENAYAISVLAKGRGGLPTYEPLGRLVTYLIPLRRRHAAPPAVTRVRDESELELVAAAVNGWNRRHQLAPVYGAGDLSGGTPLLPAFDWRDILVLRDGDRIAGTLAVWDQSRFKQTVVAGYSRRMRAVRVPYNGYAAARGLPSLPRARAGIATLHGVLLTAADDDPAIADAVVCKAREAWGATGHAYLAVALADGHPLAPALRRHAARVLASRVYAVYWPNAEPPSFDRSRRLHFDAATL
jgi:hypothetical protein